ncbi:MAG: hypothetical protein HOJ55_04235 [Euryarchaeota archaeon]|jgi:hypothetical protein|nr:hypothetical protein [Euryarchaeota archaeon]MBT5593039.1 hypothetical protein [Euryarchaeota archaeon]
MPTCRLCSGTYPREFFIHGNGPNSQVCTRCGVEHGMVSKDNAPNLYDDTLKSARLSTVSRRYRPFLYLTVLWGLYITTVRSISPWGMYMLIMLTLLTLASLVLFITSGARYTSTLTRLTPDYERPKGH